MTWTAEVTNKFRDSSNFNIVAEITYTDGISTIVERLPSVSLTDADIAEQARKRIRNVLEVGDAALAALTTGPIKIPDDPAPDPKAQAVAAASIALQIAFRDAQVTATGDVVAIAALQALKDAQAAQAQIASADAVAAG